MPAQGCRAAFPHARTASAPARDIINGTSRNRFCSYSVSATPAPLLWDVCVSFRGVIEDDGKAIKAWTESSGEGRYLSIYINEFTHIYFIYIWVFFLCFFLSCCCFLMMVVVLTAIFCYFKLGDMYWV